MIEKGARWRRTGKRIARLQGSLGRKERILGAALCGLDRFTRWVNYDPFNRIGFQRRGGWDVLSDKVTGQRQNNDRIIRRFENNDTVTVYWQSKKNGEYSGESGKDPLKRVLEAQ